VGKVFHLASTSQTSRYLLAFQPGWSFTTHFTFSLSDASVVIEPFRPPKKNVAPNSTDDEEESSDADLEDRNQTFSSEEEEHGQFSLSSHSLLSLFLA